MSMALEVVLAMGVGGLTYRTSFSLRSMSPEDLVGPCTKEESHLAQPSLVWKRQALPKTAWLRAKNRRTTATRLRSASQPLSPGPTPPHLSPTRTFRAMDPAGQVSPES